MSGGFSGRVTSEENDFPLPVSIRGQLLNAKKNNNNNFMFERNHYKFLTSLIFCN